MTTNMEWIIAPHDGSVWNLPELRDELRADLSANIEWHDWNDTADQDYAAGVEAIDDLLAGAQRVVDATGLAAPDDTDVYVTDRDGFPRTGRELPTDLVWRRVT